MKITMYGMSWSCVVVILFLLFYACKESSMPNATEDQDEFQRQGELQNACKLINIENSGCNLSKDSRRELDGVASVPNDAIGRVLKTPLLCRIDENSLPYTRDGAMVDGPLFRQRNALQLYCSWNESMPEDFLAFNESSYLVYIEESRYSRMLKELLEGYDAKGYGCKWIRYKCATLKVHDVIQEDALGAQGGPVALKQQPVFQLILEGAE